MSKRDVEMTPGVDFQTRQPRLNEPFFGPGAWQGLAWLMGFATMVAVTRYFL